SMMRRASSTSRSWTEIFTLLALSTARGNTAWEMPDDATAGMPCASSRLRTTPASMFDGVVKITTSSGNGLLHLVDLEENHRHVVVLRRVADERGNLAQHARAQLVRRQVRVALRQLPEAVFAEALVARIHRLADAVGEEQVQIARPERDHVLLQQPLERLAVVDLQPDDEAVGREDLRLRAVRAAR